MFVCLFVCLFACLFVFSLVFIKNMNIVVLLTRHYFYVMDTSDFHLFENCIPCDVTFVGIYKLGLGTFTDKKGQLFQKVEVSCVHHFSQLNLSSCLP